MANAKHEWQDMTELRAHPIILFSFEKKKFTFKEKKKINKTIDVKLDQKKKRERHLALNSIILKQSESFFYLILWNPGLYM